MLGVVGSAGHDQIGVEAAHDRVDLVGQRGVARSRGGGVEQYEHALTAGAVGRPGHALTVARGTPGAPAPRC